MAWFLATLLSVAGAAAPPAPGETLFAVEILPLLRAKCFACHGNDAEEIKGDLDVTHRDGLLRGGESGAAAIKPGDPENSPLFQAVLWNDLEMPPKENDRLTPAQTELVRQWLLAGAPWPGPERVAELRKSVAEDSTGESDRRVMVHTSGGLSDDWTHRRYAPADIWAWQPLPQARRPDGDLAQQHPLDAFIQQRLDEAGLSAAPRASRTALARRATLDLTGLPPTPDEVAKFANDENPAAMERLIDQLLASPRYGERWGRHWLDVVRYADSAGFANDFERPHAWRYRDYVIRSFNADKPFDRFLMEQIAGDELDPLDADSVIATGFLRMGPWEHTGMAVEAVTRQGFLDDVTNAVGESFLGVNMTCCRCHDHKFDPLPTRDYYRMQAVFAPTQFGDRALPFLPDENTSGFDAGRARSGKQLREAERMRAALRAKNKAAVRKLLELHGVDDVASLPAEARTGNLDFLGLTDLEKSLQKIASKRIAYFQRELARYKAFAYSVYNGPFLGYGRIQNSPTAYLPEENARHGSPQPVRILQGGALESPGEVVQPGVLSAIDIGSPEWPAGGHGRRLALAKWLADPRHPLTSRVIVNRVWHYHFGRGLVATPNAFGKMGSKPTHPLLLDFLARWLIDNEWSLKKLHRFIMTSATYQRQAAPLAAQLLSERDAQNELLSCFPARRLTAEELRDVLLSVTGELNSEMGGPGCFPEINWDVALQPRQIMGTVAPAYQPARLPAERNRRTVYVFRFRTLANPLLEVFNQPGADLSCAARDETTVTPQVLALFNGQFAHDRALALAHRVTDDVTETTDRITAVFVRLLGREPTFAELESCAAHVRELTAWHKSREAQPVEPPTSVRRGMVEELTGRLFEFEDRLTLMEDYVPDLKPWQVNAATRALAELCLVVINSNEFLYVY